MASGDYMVTARVGPTSTYMSFATGCPGSRGVTRLVPWDTPRIGSVQEVNLLDLPLGVAFMVFGWTRPSPQSLANVGMPGCTLHVSPDMAMLIAGSGSSGMYRLPIPPLPALVGLRFYNQALVLDPAAGNVLGAVVSDAAEGVVGMP
jgi:hypothetical protein